jgi:cell wall assembly regulator SMI1
MRYRARGSSNIKEQVAMSIFSLIKDKIFGHAAATAPQPTAEAAPAAATEAASVPDAAPAPVAETEVDVEASLASMDGADDLNWQTSIVDLMKLVGIDSSLSNRKELAQELGYTGDLDGSAEMNIWLHKATMQQLAANGGKVPASMLD